MNYYRSSKVYELNPHYTNDGKYSAYNDLKDFRGDKKSLRKNRIKTWHSKGGIPNPGGYFCDCKLCVSQRSGKYSSRTAKKFISDICKGFY
jgi:hypothetical protein